jgi:hypothetical protein
MSNDASFRDFMSKLVKSGSDKDFMHHKKYQSMMEPIIEEQVQPVHENNDDGSIDMVDYDGSDNEEDRQEEEQDVEDIQGVILALGAPSLEHECTSVVIPVDGSQPEAENFQEDMQEGLTQEEVQGTSVGDGRRLEINILDPVQPTRSSTRIVEHPQATSSVVDGTRTQQPRNTLGTNLNAFNSFAILDDEDIRSRALEMCVDPDTFTLENINHIKDLEIARHNLNCKSQLLQNENKDAQPAEPSQVLFLGFGEQNDEEEDFAPVVSRRTRKRLKCANKIQRSMEKK